MKIGLCISRFQRTGRSGFRQRAGNFISKKCGGLPTAAATAVLFAFAGNLFAADIAADFSAANKLYAKGKFSDAAGLYEKILQTGAQSPALLFNYAQRGIQGRPSRQSHRRVSAGGVARAARRGNPRKSRIRPQSGPGRNSARKPLAKLARPVDA